MTQQSTLENVVSYSFPANNLFQISLVRDADPNRKGYKKQYFCFLTLAPGEQGQQGGRTFNFSNRINMKQDIHKVLALAYAIRACARGQQQMIGKWSLFTDSSRSGYSQGGGVKMVFVNQFNNQKDQKNPRLQVSLGFKQGQNNPIGLIFDVPDALALADVIEGIGKRGLQLEMNGSSVEFNQAPSGQRTQSQPGGQPAPGPFSQDGPPPGPPQGQGGPPPGPPQGQPQGQPQGSGFPDAPQGQPQGGGRSPNDVANNFTNAMDGMGGGQQAGGPPGVGFPGNEDDIPF